MLSINLKKQKEQRGVALLYAVLLVSIVLTISLSLLNITFKQIVLTAVNKESQRAHFTAMSALDCVYFTDLRYRTSSVYFDNPFGYFSADSLNLSPPSNPPSNPAFSCPISGSGNAITASVDQAPGALGSIGPSVTGITSSYTMIGSGLVGSCAVVEIAKVLSGDYDGNGNNDNALVMATARGYNTCDESSPRRVERRFRSRNF